MVLITYDLIRMSGRFDWEFDQEIQAEAQPGRAGTPRVSRRSWFVVAAVLLLLAGLWAAGRWQLARTERIGREEAQTVLNLLSQAAANNDSELFFALQAADPAWRATLLQPEQQKMYRANPQITRAESSGENVWANVTWMEDGHEQQRLVFFKTEDNQLRQIPPPRDYWGARQRSHHHWGDLLLYEADQEWSDDVAAYVNELVQTRCAGGNCLPARQPFTLEIRPDYSETAAPNLLYIPSPRLMALDADGQPQPTFWDAIDRRLRAHLYPVTIRFAVPPLLQQAVDYRSAAAAFMSLHPEITIELVELEWSPEEVDETLAEYDGAAYVPSEAMLLAGLVYDLTDLAASDPDFDQRDFYEQIWQGAMWQERMWVMPLAGQMRLLFYDRQAYRDAMRSEPSPRWTWSRMERDMRALQTRASLMPRASGASWTGMYSLLDVTRDTLYSYAYGTRLTCTDRAAIYCVPELSQTQVDVALEWYRRLLEANQMPAVAGALPDERTHLIVNWQSSQRRAAIWVDEPVRYEHHLLISSIGVVPFPSQPRFDGIASGVTPLWVHGGFISQQSNHPQAVWKWLAFLSDRPLNATLRYVPARPSVAGQGNFWEILPRPLGNAMRVAFPFARPVLISEQELIGDEELVDSSGLANRATNR
jgi:ABC-type glycerol-3-phosphate transport system substrate-binding protein